MMGWLHRFARFGSIALAAIALTTSGLLAQDAPPPAPYYYYANGERIALGLSTEYIALMPVAVDEDLTLETALAASGAWQPAAVARQTWVLAPIEAANEAEAMAQVAAVRAVEGAAAASAGAWVNPVFTLGRDSLILTDELIVRFPDGIDRAGAAAAAGANGAAIVRELLPGVYLLRVTSSQTTNALALANHLTETGAARYAEPNWWILSPSAQAQALSAVEPTPAFDAAAAEVDLPAFTPNDQFQATAWYVHNFAQFGSRSGETVDADIDGREAWDIERGETSVRIAILDDGVQTTHPDLDDKIVAPFDAIGNDTDPNPTDNAAQQASDFQGTALAGLAAAETNNTPTGSGTGIGIVGVCHFCLIIPVRVLATDQVSGNKISSIADIVEGIDHAVDNGAAVINIGWVFGASTTIAEALRTAALDGRGGLGTVIVASPNVVYQGQVSYPARLSAVIPGMLAIGASTYCDTIKVNSSGTSDPADCSEEPGWGSEWGSEINLAAPAHYMVITDLTGVDGAINGDYAGGFGGTSAAAAITSGVAGLLLSDEPTLTSEQVRDRLMQTTDPLHTEGFDLASGWGRLNAQKALAATITNTGTPNDSRATAAIATTLPFNVSQSVMGAFTSFSDPVMSCTGSSQLVSNTVWFAFDAPYTMTVNANTLGSNFNTVMAVYNSDLTTELACNNDVSGGIVQSAFSFSATGGQRYWFLIGDLTSLATPEGSFNPAQMNFSLSTSTPEPRHTATVTVRAEGLSGGGVDVNNVIDVSYQLRRGAETVVNGNVATDLAATFTLSDLRPGSYTLRVKHAQTVATTVTFDLFADGTVNVGTLKTGDANNDNVVNVSDFAILAAAFGSQTGDANYDARANFNRDTAITIADFSLLASNFGTAGAAALP